MHHQFQQIHLDINGQTVQEGCTSDMLYKIDELVSYISQFFTLKTGDLIKKTGFNDINKVKVYGH